MKDFGPERFRIAAMSIGLKGPHIEINFNGSVDLVFQVKVPTPFVDLAQLSDMFSNAQMAIDRGLKGMTRRGWKIASRGPVEPSLDMERMLLSAHIQKFHSNPAVEDAPRRDYVSLLMDDISSAFGTNNVEYSG